MGIEISEIEALHLVMAIKEMCYGCDEYSTGWSGCEKCHWNKLKLKLNRHHIDLITERKKGE